IAVLVVLLNTVCYVNVFEKGDSWM
ncbi:MAG: hypothetical protein ACI90V_014268, partial [Bacillariaceae sp.]